MQNWNGQLHRTILGDLNKVMWVLIGWFEWVDKYLLQKGQKLTMKFDESMTDLLTVLQGNLQFKILYQS